MSFKILLSLLFAGVGLQQLAAQRPLPSDTTRRKDSGRLVKSIVVDTLSKERSKPVKPSSIKPYKEIVNDSTITQKGLFWVHKNENTWYFEIPDSLLGKEILIVNRFAKVPNNNAKTYGGEIISQKTIKFEKGPDKNIFIRSILEIANADSTDQIYKAVQNSNVNPLEQAFPIVAYGKDSNSTVINVTDFFRGDNTLVGLSGGKKSALGASALATDRSYIESIKSYPINIEIKTVKTYMGSAPPAMMGGSIQIGFARESSPMTMELNSSFLLLPSTPMRKRMFDNRVGFFAHNYTEYGDNQQKVEDKTFIVRWKLEPKDEDKAKWEKGQLVEPKKQIVYYIDPATPKQWRPYLIAGINDWQKAFEKAGFKNAIVAKEWPENDTTMSMEDARYSVVRYFASDVENAYGPNVHDPRSGEILESHIGWYHNVMKLVHDWYMLQAAAIDPKARKMKFDDELMGQLIRFVSSHEIGHTLGLRHNMGSSSKTPVELLRNKKWVEANGHTASIMDYARFNYVAQPEDNISEKGIFPRIGEYDNWAIKWGYSYSGAKNDEEDKKIMNKWIIDNVGKNPRLWFGGEGRDNDPRSQTEDLGDDNMIANSYGIKNLQYVLTQLPTWTREEADNYSNLTEMYKQLVIQYSRYMGHVARNIGGVQVTYKSVEEPGNVYAATPKEKQKRAVAFLQTQLFDTPEWLLNKEILGKIYNPTASSPVQNVQSALLDNLLSSNKLSLLSTSRQTYGDTTYGIVEYIDDLHQGIWKELSNGKNPDTYRKNLQRRYITDLIALMGQNTPAGGTQNGDFSYIARKELKKLFLALTNASSSNVETQYHYEDLAGQIQDFFNKK